MAKVQPDKLLDLANIRRALARKSYARYVEYAHQGRWIPAKHLLFICNKVETFIQEKTGHPYDILVLQMPPQHGKSQSITETLPSWYLGKWPYHRVIEVSYNDTFAQKFGRRNREKIKQFGEELFGISLSKGKDSNEEFELSNNVGGMISRGIMSGVTGNPANCFPAGTMIATEQGEIEISCLVAMENLPRVWSYCHSCDKIQLREIVARRERLASEFTTIETVCGNKIKSTREHRYYETERGYTEATVLNRGNKLLSIRDTCLPNMQPKEITGEQNLPTLLQENKKIDHNYEVQLLREGIRKNPLRIRKTIKQRANRLLLFKRMSGQTFQGKICPKMFGLRRHSAEQSQQVLLKRVQGIREGTQTSTDKLSRMWEILPTFIAQNRLLFKKMRRQSTFRENEGHKQFSLQKWRKLFQMVCRNATNHIGTRQLHLRLLWGNGKNNRQNEFKNTSHRRGSNEQFTRESYNVVRNLPHEAPQIGTETVSRITNTSEGSIPVYDIQVEGTHNFFANGVLVHNCIIIDDPIKNREEADSENNREKQWDEWQNSIKTRLAAGAKVIVIMCLTGDTPILMADGTEKALRNIHIGDNVATYQNGKLAVSVVQNWKNQGSDLVFTIRMESGIIIKGNERHPFLVERDGYTEWVRIKNLKAGDKILRARRTGGNGEEFCVQKKTAMNPQSARDIATPITISSFGRVGTDLRRLTRNPDERRDLSTGTESVLPNTTLCLLRKTESAPCVENCLAQTYEHIGVENSASTMIMSQEKCEDSCATTVILQSGMEKQKKNYSLPLNMFEIIPDSIVDIVESGYEDVFDIQVESTENFIANGLVSHNTRWHEDDLAGKILKSEKNVTLISLPCEAEENDPLGREAGQALFPEIGKDDEWLKQFKDSFMHDPFIEGGGARAWNALYQQRPSALEGAMIKRQWWKFYKEVPKNYNQLLQSWDMTFKDSDGSDFVSGQVWGNVGANIYMLPDREYGRMDFTATISAFRSLTSRNPGTNIKLVEDKANGPAVIAMLRKEIRGIIPINPKGSKIARVSSVTPLIEAGNVYLPDPSICPWINEFIEECASFPNGAHDDQVDAMSQALSRLMYSRNDAPLPETRDAFIYRDAQETNGYTGGEIPRSYIDW